MAIKLPDIESLENFSKPAALALLSLLAMQRKQESPQTINERIGFDEETLLAAIEELKAKGVVTAFGETLRCPDWDEEDGAHMLNLMEALAPVVLKENRPALAIMALQRMFALHQKAHDTLGEAKDLGNIGALLLRMGRAENAIGIFKDCLARFENGENNFFFAKALANLGIAQGLTHDHENGLKNLLHARDIFQKLGDETNFESAKRNIEQFRLMMEQPSTTESKNE